MAITIIDSASGEIMDLRSVVKKMTGRYPVHADKGHVQRLERHHRWKKKRVRKGRK